MTPEDCPKWKKCSAPICPLDPDWKRRSHVPREPICLWLREWAKQPSGGGWSVALGEERAARVAEVAPQAMAAWSDIRATLKAASRKGSKRRNRLALTRLKNAQQPPGTVESADALRITNRCRNPGIVPPVPTRESGA